MEKDDRDASSYDNCSLNAFFARLEDVLRSALSAFFDQTPGLGEKSSDVRTMLNVLHLKWDDSAGTGKSPASAVVHLEGSPVVAAHFKFIKTLLNRFHHSQKTNWELIKQGRDSAVCVLGALHDYANIDTHKARESLLVLWRAAKADRVGDYAYDSEPKIVVEGWPFGSRRAGAGRPRVLLKGVPAGVTPAVVAQALKVQDFDVPHSSIRPLGPTAMVVELHSEADRQSLLGLGNLIIKKAKARFVTLAKAEEEPAVVLYLTRDIGLDVVAAAWGNEHHDLAQTKIGYDGGNKRVVVIQVTAKQLAEVQGKTVTISRAKIEILPFTPYRLRLRLPSPTLVGPALRSALRHHVPDKEIAGLTQVDALCAVLHLRSAECVTKLVRSRHLTTTCTTATAAPSKTGPGPTSAKVANGQTTPASPAKRSAKRSSAKGGAKAEAAEVLPGSAKSPAASKEAKGDKKKNKKQAEVALVLHPVVNMGIDDLGKKLGHHCQANAEIFLTIRGQRAYAEVTSEQADRALAKPFVPDGVTINVERYQGEVPLIKVGLRPSLPAVPKGQVSQAIIRAFGQLNAGRLGHIDIGPDAIHVPVSTEACLKRLLKAGSVAVSGKQWHQQLAVFDPSVVVQEKRLQDLVEMHFLRKSRGTLKQLQDQHAVIIAVRLARPTSSSPEAGRGGRGAAAGRGQAGRGRGGRAKAALMEQPKAMEPMVEVKGSAETSVDRAMTAIESLLSRATRKQSSFNPREARFSTLLDAKMKELGQTDPDIAVCTTKQPGGGLTVHMMGSNRAKVEALAQRPNHYMTKLTAASLQLNTNQFKRIQVAQLTKAYGVLIEHDAKRGEVTVFGPREATKACIEDMKPIATTGGGQAQKTAAPQLTLTASHALFFKEHIHVNYRQLRVRPLKKGAIVVTGPPEDLDLVEHLIDKLKCYVLPFYLSLELADGFAAYVGQQLSRRGIAAVIYQSIVSNDDEDSDAEEAEDEGEDEDEDVDEDEDQDESEGEGKDVTYISNCGHEDQEWAQIEVWCFNMVPTYTATMGFFACELPHAQTFPTIMHRCQPWVHVDTINRVITCVGFEELSPCKQFISDVLSQRGTADSRLVYAVSASTITGLEPLLQQFGIEYLTYTVGHNDYRIAVQASTIVQKLLEKFGLRK